jgi:hypothetical protein
MKTHKKRGLLLYRRVFVFYITNCEIYSSGNNRDTSSASGVLNPKRSIRYFWKHIFRVNKDNTPTSYEVWGMGEEE